ncbi:MAG: protein kinase [Proteobacteria bacterium]|nr:protein kinase [Pseudomonadota bacterium]
MGNNPNIGRVLEGKYEIVRVLGSGGMGEVYEAKHRLIKRRVAVKLLHQEYATESNVVQRFQREARASAAIGHDHIVGITDMGTTETGELYIVMEYLEGKDLQEILENEGPVGPRRACHIMIQILSALEAAHSKGIVHRDLKPANVFLTTHARSPDYVKLVDFGISKVRANEDGMTKGLTRTGVLLGTPSYMSPEQAKGQRDITPSTDIYSCGVILYEMMTGELPFKETAIIQLLIKIMNQAPPDPASLRPDIPSQLANTILRAMEKPPEKRFKDVTSFRRTLTQFSPETAELTGLDATRITERPSEWKNESVRYSRDRRLEASVPANIKTSTPLEMASSLGNGQKKNRRPILIGTLICAATAMVLALFTVYQFTSENIKSPSHVVPLTAVQVPFKNTDSSKEDSQKVPKRSPAQESQAPKPMAKAREVESELSVFRVSVKPVYAIVSVDGKKLGQGSFEVPVPADGKKHRVSVRAPGFKRYLKMVVFKGDISLAINLERVNRVSSKAKKAKNAGKNSQETEPKTIIREQEAEPTEEAKDKLESKTEEAPKKGRIIDRISPWSSSQNKE